MATVDFVDEEGNLIDTMEVDDDEYAAWEAGAERAGQTIEEFILSAIHAFTEIHRMETTPEQE